MQEHQVWGLGRSAIANVMGERFRSSICDVSSWEGVAQSARTVAQEPAWGEIHALIHCAAQQGPIGPAIKVDPTAWTNAVRANLDGTFHVIRAFHDLLRGRDDRHAKVLCFSGGGATKPRPNFSAYAASKTAVVRLVETLAEEWRGKAIDINSIAPGALSTRMTEELVGKGADAAGEAEIAVARATLSAGRENFDRLGRLVDFLLSADSDGISGKLISAPWDPWEKFGEQRERLQKSDLLTLRRISPEHRGTA